jgi:antibiotic biosynthesis monooxygenase (ABM) superfamily enzyme
MLLLQQLLLLLLLGLVMLPLASLLLLTHLQPQCQQLHSTARVLLECIQKF